MASGAFFVRPCPTCGRNLQIRVELLNREVQCRHCRAEFIAAEHRERPWLDEAVEEVLAKAERYIESTHYARRASPFKSLVATAAKRWLREGLSATNLLASVTRLPPEAC